MEWTFLIGGKDEEMESGLETTLLSIWEWKVEEVTPSPTRAPAHPSLLFFNFYLFIFIGVTIVITPPF